MNTAHYLRSGREVIAAYGKTTEYIAQEEHLTDEFLVCNWAMLASSRLLGLAVDTSSFLVVACAAFFSVFGRDTVGAITASIALTYSLQVLSINLIIEIIKLKFTE